MEEAIVDPLIFGSGIIIGLVLGVALQIKLKLIKSK